MNWNQFTDSLSTFHFNAVNHLIYTFSTSWWLFLLVIGALATAVMGLQCKAGSVVREEQNIL